MSNQLPSPFSPYQHACENTAKLAAKFRSVGFQSCVLRGVALAQLYPSPDSRPEDDIYLWVKGRSKDVSLWMKEQGDIDNGCKSHIVFKPNTLPNPIFNYRLQKWYSEEIQRQVKNDDRLGFVVPTTSFLAIQSLIDSYNRLRGGSICMRDIWDYYYILLALKPDERVAILGLIKRLGLTRMAEAMMWVQKEKCGLQDNLLLCQPNEKRGLRLLEKLS